MECNFLFCKGCIILKQNLQCHKKITFATKIAWFLLNHMITCLSDEGYKSKGEHLQQVRAIAEKFMLDPVK